MGDQARWMAYFMDNPMNKWMIWGYPMTQEPPVWIDSYSWIDDHCVKNELMNPFIVPVNCLYKTK